MADRDKGLGAMRFWAIWLVAFMVAASFLLPQLKTFLEWMLG